MQITRLAPSPTGAMHLGNVRTFLANWLLARQRGWRIVLRIEDLDGPRIKRGADHQAMQDLAWLGLDWDEGPIYQSDRVERYRDAVMKLLAEGAAYPCVCSRREAAWAAGAPHAEDGAAVYSGTCRGRFKSVAEALEQTGRAPAIRFAVPDRTIAFNDGFAGGKRVEAARRLGDFVIAKTDGTPAYQLAVVVDDAEMGVTRVVRGDDLLDSVPRQILLYEALGMEARLPEYFHLPLVTGPDGRRLAKRHGDTRLGFYRERGVGAGRVLGLLGRWCGVQPRGEIRTAADLLPWFSVEDIPRDAITFTVADDAALRMGSKVQR